MLHTKAQGNQHFCSGEEVKGLLSYKGVVSIMVIRPGPFEQTSVSPTYRSFHILNLSLIVPIPSEEMFENVDRRHWYTISSPMSLSRRCQMLIE